MRSYIFLLFLFFTTPLFSFGEKILGDISDLSDKKELTNVNIVNVHTNAATTSDEFGKFSITVSKGDLIEFRKIGYKTVRLRIPQGSIPSYFKIIMQKGAIELPQFELRDENRNYKKDSIRYYEIYKNAIEFPQLNGLDAIQHPFSALSKRNRRIWAFQKEYAWWEQEKYIDYTFNEKLVTSITGLQGDSVKIYMKKYRPTYEQLRSMNEYTFYTFIKETVKIYRTGRQYRPSIRRSSN